MSTWTAADIHRLGPPTIQLSVVSIWLPSLSETQGTSKKTSLSDDEVKTAAKMWFRQKDAPHLYRVGLVRLHENWCGSVNKIHSSHGVPMRRPERSVVPSTRRLCRGDSWYRALVLFRQQDTPLSWRTHEITWTLVWFRQQDSSVVTDSWYYLNIGMFPSRRSTAPSSRTREPNWTLAWFSEQDTPMMRWTYETTWTLAKFCGRQGWIYLAPVLGCVKLQNKVYVKCLLCLKWIYITVTERRKGIRGITFQHAFILGFICIYF